MKQLILTTIVSAGFAALTSCNLLNPNSAAATNPADPYGAAGAYNPGSYPNNNYQTPPAAGQYGQPDYNTGGGSYPNQGTTGGYTNNNNPPNYNPNPPGGYNDNSGGGYNDNYSGGGGGTGGGATTGGRDHRVVKGDTLSSLARRYGVSVADLMRANSLPSDRINVGQSLRIP